MKIELTRNELVAVYPLIVERAVQYESMIAVLGSTADDSAKRREYTKARDTLNSAKGKVIAVLRGKA